MEGRRAGSAGPEAGTGHIGERGVISLDAVAAFGSRRAIVAADGGIVTHRELACRAGELARMLGAGRRLVVLSPDSSVDSIALLLGAIAEGHVVALASGEAVLTTLVDRYDPDVVIVADDAGLAIEHRHDEPAHPLHRELALLMGTSGSTGTPKLVRLSHANLRSNARAIARYLRLDSSDCAALTLPLHYCYGLSLLHSHLVVGGSVVVPPASVVDPCFWNAFEAAGATTLAGVPHTFDLLDSSGFDRRVLPSLRRVTQAGGKLAPVTVRRYAELGRARGWDFYAMYGQTEATARMAYLPPALAVEHPGAVGVPVPGGAISIDHHAAPSGAEPDVGEIVYRGPNVMLGYATHPSDLSRGRTVDVLRTGDLGRRGVHGLVEIVGRLDRVTKIAGERVDLERIEMLLRAAGVAADVVASETHLLVAVPAADGAGPSVDASNASREIEDAVHAVLRDHLALPLRRVRAFGVVSLPRTPAGKVDRVALRRELSARVSTKRPVARVAAPRGLTADAAGAPPGPEPRPDDIAEVFERTMGIARPRSDDTYAGLGGDSLGYVELSTELEARFGALPTNWHLMTIAELARSLLSDAARRSLATDVVLRAAAIVLVVATHTRLVEIKGGAHFLLALAGYNFARFVLARSFGVDLVGRVMLNARRLIIPASLFIVFAVIQRGESGLAKLLFVHNYAVGGRWRYWFVEVLVQILLVCAASFASARVRRRAATSPFAFAAGSFALTAAISIATRLIPVSSAWTLTHNAAWLFTFGWAVEHAVARRHRVALSFAAAAVLLGYFGDRQREFVVFAGLMALTWLPRIVVPRVVAPLIAGVASASFAIYLSHFDVLRVLGTHELPHVVILVVAITAGVVGDRAVRRSWRRLRGLTNLMRPSRQRWRADGALPVLSPSIGGRLT